MEASKGDQHLLGDDIRAYDSRRSIPAGTNQPSRRLKAIYIIFPAIALIGCLGIKFYFSDAAHETPIPFSKSPLDDSPFKWKPCPDVDADTNLLCGKLMVPLHYLDKNNTQKIPVAVIKYPAQKDPVLGSIVFNPGGPGGSGVSMIKNSGSRLSRLVGGHHDVISFDPRGIGESHPVICFNRASEHALYDRESNTFDAPGFPGSLVTLKEFAARKSIHAEGCRKHSGEFLKYVSTSYTARDMDEIRKGLGEELLNYWGFSYGTALGTYYANMFPDRVGRFIIDGVIDPELYVSTYVEDSRGTVIHTDEVLEAFGLECEKAGPERCPLAAVASSPSVQSKYNITPFKSTSKSTVSAVIKAFLESLVDVPIPAPTALTPGVLTRKIVASILLGTTYSPLRWSPIASAFAQTISTGDAAPLLNLVHSKGEDAFCPIKDGSGSSGNPAVKCNDGADESKGSLDEFLRGAEEVEKVSWFAGRAWTLEGLICKYWPVKAAERFTGPWNKTLKNKILIIGNTLDPVTPIEGAKAVFRLSTPANSVLLVQEGIGHCSTAQPSLCTLAVIENLFVNGTLPEQGTRCISEDLLFPPQGLNVENGKVKDAMAVADFTHGVLGMGRGI